ncbi:MULTISPECIES: DMT family transporter [Legionella]|uniref:EamA-like transporter family protein n=1 Tax=Legionella maceachernii TaxID=466 RepID=A0A0W0W175_9GAMM|nr:DMT family transporter [Legionella maceachernii]KTD26017.1 EamA-like transporter family protein [Legionella maceachernii]SJZ50727.1 EamA-like transporter family protein [Legionella maceachernii]SUP03735.1 carboxylate/amino acid/amine transporter [Legionella maceachernii]
MERIQSLKLGLLYGVISAFSFATMSVFVKKIGGLLPTSQLIFFRFAISLMILLPWIITDKTFRLKVEHPMQYVVRILAGLMALFCVFYVVKFLPLVDALLLNNTAPLFVPLIAWALLGAKTPKKAILGIIIGFLGVGLILNPGHEILSFASVIALASGFLTALAIVQMRIISKSSSTKQMLFYYFMISTLASGFVAALQWESPESSEIWLFLLAIGVFGTSYQIFATLSYATAPVRLMSPLVFLIVVFGGFFDWLIWDYVPNLFTLLGAILVIIGTIITVYFGHKEIDFLKNNQR